MQTAFVYADRGDVAAELIDRALAVQTNGYLWTAVAIENIHDTLQTYPAQMANWESDHLRTHPPGLLLANWLTLQLTARWPGLTQALAPPVWAARCTDLWLLDSPPHVAAALGIWAWLPLLVAATAIFPAYLFAQQLTSNPRTARLAALLVALLPALLIFTPTPDQISAVLALWLLWLFHTGWLRQSLWRLTLAGLLLALLTFLSLGNALLLLPLVVFALLNRPPVPFLARATAVFTLSAASIWLIYWLGWGVPPWAIAQAGLAEHAAIVAAQRHYATWALFNPVDLLTFVGLPSLAGFLGACLALNRSHLHGNRGWLIATAVLFLFLNFSGSTRGEVGRIWLFAMPLLALLAGLFWGAWLSARQTAVLIAAQLLLVLAIGLAWQPISAVIVVAERPSAATPTSPPTHPLTEPFGDHITLMGYDLTRSDATLDLTLYWQSSSPTQRPYTVFTQLLAENQQLVAQQDNWPVNGRWPATCWQPGETIADSYRLNLPANLPATDYKLLIGLYDARDGTRLTTASGADFVEIRDR